MRSPRVIVPFVVDLLAPQSVVDVGCGLGQWLRVFKEHGVQAVMGPDGPHVPNSRRLIAGSEFCPTDLESPIHNHGRYDVAISLEVAEHLHEKSASNFVTLLTSLSDTIVFSAAIPGQTGENHHNEQPHEYWHQKFRDRGFEVLDAFRPRFWNDENVNWWYRQNMYLVVRRPMHERLPFPIGGFTAVHPEMLKMYETRLSDLSSRVGLKGLVRRIWGKR